jgi:ribokinase
MRRTVVIGSLNIDVVVPVERMPAEGETLAGGDLALHGGGKGANQAAAAARLGGSVTMIGQVGGDAFGTRLSGDLAAAGVDISGIGKSERATGSACIYVLPSGENAIVISPGANATVSPAIAHQRLDAVSPYNFLLTQLEIPVETVVEAFAHARRNGATTILDPAPFRPMPAELTGLTDLITPNQSEAAALLGSRDKSVIRSVEDARQAAAQLRDAGYRGVILKLGELGCYVDAPEAQGAVPAFAVAAMDTTAAGDVFNAALAVALAKNVSLMDAALYANAAAAISVTRRGAQSSIPTASEVDAFFKDRRSAVCSQ